MSVDLSLSNASLFELITKHKHCFLCRGVILPGEKEHIIVMVAMKNYLKKL